MENYYDVVTPEELERALGYFPDEKEIAEDKAWLEKEPDLNLEKLALLYISRGNREKYEYYRDKIVDLDRKIATDMLAFECVD